MPDDTPAPEDSPAKTSKKTPWKKKIRRWLMFFSILGVIVFAVNGPIARWGIHKFALRSLEKIGLQGDFEIDGSIAGGFVIRDAELDGTKSLRKLHFSLAEVSYDLNKLIEEQVVEVLRIEDLDLVIDIAYREPDTEEKKTEPPPPVWETLTKIQPYIEANPIEASNAQITLVQGEQLFSTFKLEAFSHEPGSEDLRMLGFTGTRSGVTTEKQDITVSWLPESMRLDRWRVLPDFLAAGIEMDWEGDYLHQIGGLVTVGGSPFEINYLPTGELRVNQQQGPALDSETVSNLFGVALPLRVSLTATSLELSQMDGNFSNWNLDLNADFKNFVFGDLLVPELSLAAQQRDAQLQAALSAVDESKNLAVDLSSQWLEPTAAEWWLHGQGEVSIDLGQMGQWLDGISRLLELDDYQIGGGDLELEASGAWAPVGLTELQLSGDFAALTWRGASIPELAFQASQKSAAEWEFELHDSENQLQASGALDLTAKTYSGQIKADEAPQVWLNPLLNLFVPDLSLQNALSLTWSGTGSWEDSESAHDGSLDLETLSATYAELPKLAAALNVNYDWPKFVKVNSVDASYGKYRLNGDLVWQDQRIEATQLSLSDPKGQLVRIRGELPMNLDVKSATDFFEQTGPVQLQIDTPEIGFQRFAEAVKLDQQESIEEIRATLKTNLLVDGTLQNPVLKGTVSIGELRGLVDDGLAPFAGVIELDTEDGVLMLDGKLQESDAKTVVVSGSVPLNILQLIEEPDSYQDLPVDMSAKVEKLSLQRVFSFVPDLDEEIKKITGLLDFTFKLGGTLGELTWGARTNLKINEFRMIEREIPRIQNFELSASFEKGRLALEKMEGRVGGGLISASGEVMIDGLEGFDFEPVLKEFDVDLKADHAPVFRDDQILVRANADLKAAGTLEEALISGKVDIVESLFFKDIELIPFGVPSSDVSEFELPAVDVADANELPVPEPFGEWKLDLVTALKDPFLVRGNLAEGQVTGSLRVGGTLANPDPVGVLQLEKVVARLPFSKLKVDKSRIVFTEGSGLNPKLDIRGTSTLSNYDVNVYAFGTISNPEVVFSSNPPLPEAEIMTLLATGTTAEGLENADVASAKAFQLLLAELKQRSNRPGGNKLFTELVSILDEVEVNFGESYAFSNRRFNSASIEFTERWNFTAMFDQQGNTRGLVVFSIRLK